MSALVIGIDWATELHVACALGADGERLGERRIENSAEGIHSFVEWVLAKCGGEAQDVRLGVESPSLLIVEVLLERGFAVYAINPKQSDRFRDRRSTSGAKDDSRDAEVIATALLKDADCFRRVPPLEARTIAIREASRSHDELVKSRVRECAKLRETLARFVPDFLRLAKEVERDWVLSLCGSISAVGPQKVTKSRVRNVLKRHRVRRVNEEEIFSALRVKLGVHPASVKALRKRSGALIERIQLINKQIAEHKKELDELLREADGKEHQGPTNTEILLSFPGVGPVVAATFVAEASVAMMEGSYDALRAYSGVAPVTISSGKSKRVAQRRACNRRLADAAFQWAKVAIQVNSTCRGYAVSLKERGKSFGHRMRAVGDKLIRALVRALQLRERFDPERFAGKLSGGARGRADSESSGSCMGAAESINTQRVSTATLRQLRNEVPVGEVLEEIRPGSHKPGGSKLRCPNCGKQQAQLHDPANLLKCFACQSRWNPIDLLVQVAGWDFRVATEFLLRRLGVSCGDPASASCSVPPGGGTAAGGPQENRENRTCR